MTAESDPTAGAVRAAVSPPRQYLTFALDGQTFAIPILAVQEIRGWEPVSRTPRSPDYLLGVMNLRGVVVPVLDLRARLGMASRERTPTSVVIVVRVDTVRAKSVIVGCLVDAVSDVTTLAAEAGRDAPSVCGTVDEHFLSGVATVDRQLVMLLDLDRLVESSMAEQSAAA